MAPQTRAKRDRIMKKLPVITAYLATAYWLLASWPAAGADLPVKYKDVPIPVVAPSPFYVFLHAGAGFSNVQSDITLPGLATGTPKLWPAGFMAGGGFGVLSSIGPLAIGAELEGNYDFTRASIGCDPIIGTCLGYAKNSWFFAEKVLAGITLSQIAGYIPGGGTPANWPVPITVPTSFAANMMLLGVIGAAQRNVDLCVPDLVTLQQLCGSQWKNGLLVGAQMRWQISQNVHARAEYDFVTFNQTFTPTQSIPIFADTIAAKNEQRVMVGLGYNF